MKKIIRTLTIAVIALVSVFACAFAAACGSNDDNPTSDYNFTIVYEDGTAVNGQTASKTGGKVWLQICTNQCVDLNTPAINRFADENGKISLSQKDINTWFNSTTDVTEFKFHVHDVKDHKDDCEVSVSGKGDYKVTVTKN